MQQQRSLHLPAPAKTRCRTNDPGSHAPPVVFSRLNFEECSFPLFESVSTLSGYQAEGPDLLPLLRSISPDPREAKVLPARQVCALKSLDSGLFAEPSPVPRINPQGLHVCYRRKAQ